MSCGGSDEDPPQQTEKERVTELLTGNGQAWKVTTTARVTVDGVDVTDDLFQGFSITFTPTSYTTSGTTPVWPRQDTWQFKDDNATTIVRGSDGKEVTLTAVSETQLKLTLEWTETTYEGGRKRSLAGKHEFTLAKQ